MAKIADVKPGDLVNVHTKIKEGNKERVTHFQGVVMQTRGTGVSKTFTVRKISAGVGIERIFPLRSPLITKIEIKKRGKVRRAKLTYLRHRKGKRMKIRESSRKTREIEEAITEGQPPEEMEVIEETAVEQTEKEETKEKPKEKKKPAEEKQKEKPSEEQKKEKPEEKYPKKSKQARQNAGSIQKE